MFPPERSPAVTGKAHPASWQQQSLSFHPQGRIQCPRRQDRPELGLQAATQREREGEGSGELGQELGVRRDKEKVVFSNT